MSSPPNGRALVLPVVWGSGRESVGSLPVVEGRSPSDEELMSGLQAKDSKDLEMLFDRYSRLVFGIALRILNDHSEAEEAVQEAFLYIYHKSLCSDPLKVRAKGCVVQTAFSRSRDRKAHLSRRGFYSGTDIDSLDDTLLGHNDVERDIGARLDLSQLQGAL